MAIERIVIEVSGDPTKLNSTIAELEKIGKVDKNNRESFEKTASVHKKAMGESHGIAEKLNDQFKELGQQIVAAFAVERVIEFGKESVEAFVEAEKNARKLEFALKNVHGEGKATFDKLIEQSGELQEKGIFSDDAIQQAQMQLANFGLTGKQIEELIPKITDMAAATGDDLGTAVDRVIQGINGQTRGLKQIGIQYKDTGDATKNLAILTEKLTKFQGANAEETKTLAGETERLKNVWDDFKESVGEFIVKQGATWLEFWDLLTGKMSISEKLFTDFGKQMAGQMAEGLKKRIEETDKELDPAKRGNIVKKNIEELTKNVEDAQAKYLRAYNSGNTLAIEATRAMFQTMKNERDQYQSYVDHMNDKALIDTKDTEDKKNQIQKKAITDLSTQIKALQDELYEKDRNAKKEDLERKAKLDKKYADETIADETELANTKLEIDKKLADDIYAIDLDLLERKHQKDVQDIEKTNATLKQKQTMIQLLDTKFAQDQLLLLTKLNQDKLDLNASYFDELAKQSEDEMDKLVAKQEEDRAKAKKKEQEDFDTYQKLQLLRAGEDQKAQAEAEIDNAMDLFKRKKEQLDADHQAGIISEQEYRTQLEVLILESNKTIEDANKKLADDTAAQTKKILENLFLFLTDIMRNVEQAIEANIAAIDTMQARQSQMVDYQKTLAERGLANDLAFEERRADELEKKKLDEQRKLKRAKELETFLNSVAKFAEDNPSTAVAKALGVLAATKVAEVVFAEEGALLGESTNRRIRPGSLRHRSGKDILVQAEHGERILSVEQNRKFEAMGGMALLKKPFFDRPIPDGFARSYNGNMDVIRELQNLKEVVKNKSEYQVNWEQVDGRFERIEKEIKNGVTTTTRHSRFGN